MDTALDVLLFDETLTTEQRRALDAELRNDPALAEALAHWQVVRGNVRNRLAEAIPDRHTLVCYALLEKGRTDVLTDTEKALAEAARPTLEQALAAHPGLQLAFADLQQAASDFDAVWEEALPQESTPQRTKTVPAPARDRSAVRRIRGKGPLHKVWRGAAALTVVAFAALTVMLLQRDTALTTVATGSGQTELVTLADGSTVRLLENSTLTYAAEAADFDRRVTLEGNAFFDVVRAEQTFTVETANAFTTVLGTTFGVQARAEATEVVLATGKVALAQRQAQTNVVTLAPGDMSRVEGNRLPTDPVAVDLLDALAWTGQFICQNTALDQLTDRLSAHFGVTIALDDALANERINGTFSQTDDVATVLAQLALATNTDVQTEGTTYRLSAK